MIFAKGDTEMIVNLTRSGFIAHNNSKELHPQVPEGPKTRGGCMLSGPGRGDCEHFVGLPKQENEETTDEYGRPFGWCEACWQSEMICRLSSYIHRTAWNLGGKEYAEDACRAARVRSSLGHWVPFDSDVSSAPTASSEESK